MSAASRPSSSATSRDRPAVDVVGGEPHGIRAVEHVGGGGGEPHPVAGRQQVVEPAQPGEQQVDGAVGVPEAQEHPQAGAHRVGGVRVVLGQVPRAPQRRHGAVDVAPVEPQLGVDGQARARLLAAGVLAGDDGSDERQRPVRVGGQHEPRLLAQLARLAVALEVRGARRATRRARAGRCRGRRAPAPAGRGPRAPGAAGSRRAGRPPPRRRSRRRACPAPTSGVSSMRSTAHFRRHSTASRSVLVESPVGVEGAAQPGEVHEVARVVGHPVERLGEVDACHELLGERAVRLGQPQRPLVGAHALGAQRRLVGGERHPRELLRDLVPLPHAGPPSMARSMSAGRARATSALSNGVSGCRPASRAWL